MDLSSWLVLVVEDEIDSAMVVSQVFNHYGAEVAVAHNGEECLNRLSELEPTVVVMDLSMPELDGWQALAAIRNNPTTAYLPVIAITAFDSSMVQRRAREAGFDAYFSKPLQVDEFVKKTLDVVG